LEAPNERDGIQVGNNGDAGASGVGMHLGEKAASLILAYRGWGTCG
jgi:hypothetical protein